MNCEYRDCDAYVGFLGVVFFCSGFLAGLEMVSWAVRVSEGFPYAASMSSSSLSSTTRFVDRPFGFDFLGWASVRSLSFLVRPIVEGCNLSWTPRLRAIVR